MSNILNKNKEGYGYNYTDLSEIHRYLESINAKYIQKTERIDTDDYIFTKRCFNDIWEDEWLQGSRVVNATLSGIKNPAQEQGSALTYARRYSLLMAFGLSTEDDDAQSLTMPIINSKEEAANYMLTFGKYANKKLSEVPQSYLNWLMDNSKDDTIKTACDYLIEHTTKEDLDLLTEFNDLVIKTDTDPTEIYNHYKVKNNSEMTQEQLKEAVEIMIKKVK